MEVPQRFANCGIDFTCIPFLGREIHPLNDFRTVIAIRKEIRKFNPDLISLHASKAGALGRLAALGTKCPLLYTPHCWSFVDGFQNAGIYRFIEKSLAPATTKLITVSEDERQFGLSKGIGKPEQTLTIHNGVKDRFQNIETSAREADPTVKIVMVGRFEKQKDQFLLVQALNTLRDLPWKLTFLGDGPLKKDCLELVESLGMQDQIEFSGYSESVEEVLKQHDVFTLITNWEGFPRSILEAMAASLPVIVTDVGGSRESVLDGVTGNLVKGGDVNELADAIRALISDQKLRAGMGEEGRTRYLNHFTFESMFSNYRDLYRELIESYRNNNTRPSFKENTIEKLFGQKDSRPSQKAARTANSANSV